ncbi:hypothetical protein AltI4_09420 [Alteromonas sp. I4]|nr:hypothetical protein AltI4_09420 [Alteromonas sp. I4]
MQTVVCEHTYLGKEVNRHCNEASESRKAQSPSGQDDTLCENISNRVLPVKTAQHYDH